MRNKILVFITLLMSVTLLTGCRAKHFTYVEPSDMFVGETVELISSDNATWKVSDPSIAKIEGKTITALKPGIVTITVKSGKFEKSFEIQIFPKENQIEYILDGGRLPNDAPTSYVSNVGLEVLPIPSKEGYNFGGWYLNDELVLSISNTQKGDITLVAKWEAKVYTIEYVLDGGKLPTNAPIGYEYGVGVKQLATPSKEGYEFIGWKLNDEFVESISSSQMGVVILVAEWKKNNEQYKIIYSLDGGVLPNNAPTTYEENVGLQKLVTPSKDGYDFVGWYLNNELVDSISSSQKGEITLVAKWEKASYDIEYVLNGGVLEDDVPKEYIYGKGIENLPIPTKENHEFVGWFLSGISMYRCSSIDENTTGDVTLIARWVPLVNTNPIVLPDATYHFTGINKIEHSSGNGTYVYQPNYVSTGAPSGATNYNWTSSDTSVATISVWSSISAISSGYCIITGTYKSDPSITINGIIRVTSDGIEFATAEEANNYKIHTVTFVDKDGEVIEVQSVVDGGFVYAPTPTEYEGLRFVGWSQELYNIKSDLTILARYEDGTNNYVGKKFAILGDSISTYLGYIPEGYSYFYPYPTGDVNDVNQTWWMQMVNSVGGSLFVNNSYSGSCVATSESSATQSSARLAKLLIGEQKPDVIVIYMGSNDCASPYVSEENFLAGYKVMLDKIKGLCPNSEIILCTLPISNLYSNESGKAYNKIITDYAKEYQLKVIDFSKIDITGDLIDSAHPKRSGMTKLANLAIDTLIGERNVPKVSVTGENTVLVDETTQLNVQLSFVEGEISYKSSDESIATVSNTGLVTGISKGNVVITVTCGGITTEFEMNVKYQEFEVTYNYNGGYSSDLYIASRPENTPALAINNYNYNEGTFWGGEYTNCIFLSDSSSDPRPTFSDRIYIGKNSDTNLYEVISIIRSGASSWPEGAEYVIIISNSYSSYGTISKIVDNISVGDTVIFDGEFSVISKANPVKAYFFSETPSATSMTVKVDKNSKLITPSYLGYRFLGWFDDENKQYSKIEDITADVTLNAKWEELNPVTGIKVDAICDELITLETFQVVASVIPSDAYFKKISFSSSNTDIFTVSNTGLITAVNAGTATLTIIDYLEKVTYTHEITIYPVASIDAKFLEGYNGIINDDETLQIVAKAYGKGMQNAVITYQAVDPTIVSVSETGLVTALSKGTTDIIIGIKDTDINLSVTVTVGKTIADTSIDKLVELLVKNSYGVVQTGNISLYNDGKRRVYVSTYGSVNNYLFDEYSVNTTYYQKSEDNPNNHQSRDPEDSIEFVTIHDTATLTGTVESIASNMSGGTTSIHYTVGNDAIFGVVPEKYIAYHAGDGTGTVFKWTKTDALAVQNVKPTFGIIKSGTTYYLTVNGITTSVVVPKVNGAAPTVERFSILGPTWKVKDGYYYIGGPLWYSGDYATIASKGGNNNSIGIEMCSNTSGDIYDTFQRTAKLTADILIRNNLDTTRVKMHNTWSGKNCPQTMISGNFWPTFMKMVELEYTIQTTYKDAKISMVSNNPDIIDNTGRVINAPLTTKTVSYTITVELNGEVRTVTLYSVIPGSTTWEQWNGTYSASKIWNNGQF